MAFSHISIEKMSGIASDLPTYPEELSSYNDHHEHNFDDAVDEYCVLLFGNYLWLNHLSLLLKAFVMSYLF